MEDLDVSPWDQPPAEEPVIDEDGWVVTPNEQDKPNPESTSDQADTKEEKKKTYNMGRGVGGEFKEEDRLPFFEDWFDLLGINADKVYERMPIIIGNSRKTYKKGEQAAKISFNIHPDKRALNDRLISHITIDGRRIYESDSDWYRSASDFYAFFWLKLLKNKGKSAKNIDLKWYENLFLQRSIAKKIDQSIEVIGFFIDQFNGGYIDEKDLKDQVQIARNNMPRHALRMFDNTLKRLAENDGTVRVKKAVLWKVK